MPAGGLAIAGGLGLAQSAVGFINKGKAKKEAARLAASRPKYQPSPYYKDALATAESELSTGMSGEANNAYEQGIDRDLSGSLNAILKSGGSANNVAEVFSASTQGRQRLAMMKDNLRLNQINNVVRAQQLNSEEREKAFQFNEWAPWADAAKANAGARTEAEGQIWSGFNTAGSAVMSGLSEAGDKKQLDNYFSTSDTMRRGSSPGLSQTGATGPNTGANSPGFISPSVQPVDFSGLNNAGGGLPDMQSFRDY